MKNSYDNIEDMQRMQQEAIRRVQEMQRRAKQTLSAGQQYSKTLKENEQNNEQKSEPIPHTEPEKIVPEQNLNEHKIQKKNPDFFSILTKDREKSLILLLILLLVDEGADTNLIFALFYLIL